jgi:hypothetical protein
LSPPVVFSLVVLALSETCAVILHSSGVQDVDSDLKGDDLDSDACLRALGGMGWVFSNSHEREKTVHMVWEARVISGDECCRERSHQREYLEHRRAQVFHPEQRPQIVLLARLRSLATYLNSQSGPTPRSLWLAV